MHFIDFEMYQLNNIQGSQQTILNPQNILCAYQQKCITCINMRVGKLLSFRSSPHDELSPAKI